MKKHIAYSQYAGPDFKLHNVDDTCIGGANVISLHDVGVTNTGLDNRFKECRVKCNIIEECRYFAVQVGDKTSCALYKSCDTIRPTGEYITFAKLVKGIQHLIICFRTIDTVL